MRWFKKREPEAVEVRGSAVRCPVCGNDMFWRRKGLLHGAVASFLDAERTAPTCECFMRRRRLVPASGIGARRPDTAAGLWPQRGNASSSRRTRVPQGVSPSVKRNTKESGL